MQTNSHFARPAVVTIALAVICLSLTGCLRRTVLTGLNETEAREAAVALYKNQVKATLVKEAAGRGQDVVKWDVVIDGGDLTQVEAWRVLQDHGLPRPREAGVEEVYKNTQLIPTASEERAKLMLAMSGELSRSIKSMPGVQDARVHIASPDPSAIGYSVEKSTPTAAVLVKYWSDAKVKPTEQEILRLVAKSVEGLKETDISVVLTPVTPPSRDAMDDLRTSIAPTTAWLVDYVRWGASALGLILLIWIAFGSVPKLIRWVRRQIVSLRESVVDHV